MKLNNSEESFRTKVSKAQNESGKQIQYNLIITLFLGSIDADPVISETVIMRLHTIDI